jgi:tol-pal system protein YbgF
MIRQALLVFVACSLAAPAVMGAAPVSDPTSERIDRLETQVTAQVADDMPTQIRQLQDDLQELRGRLEVIEHQLVQVGNRQRDMYSDLDSRLGELESKSKNPVGIPSGPPPANPIPGSTSSVDDYQKYQSAYDLLQQKKYDEAIQAFNEYVKTYPRGQFTPNAYYWIGETHIIHKDLNAARVAFQKIVSDYPAHQKSGDAMLKLGYVYDSAGQKDKAIKTLIEVTQKYPGSSVSRMADQRINAIKQKG